MPGTRISPVPPVWVEVMPESAQLPLAWPEAPPGAGIGPVPLQDNNEMMQPLVFCIYLGLIYT